MRLTKKGGQDMDTLKILVVDDESRMRKLVKDFLTKKNFQVLEAGDGEEAMPRWRPARPFWPIWRPAVR